MTGKGLQREPHPRRARHRPHPRLPREPRLPCGTVRMGASPQQTSMVTNARSRHSSGIPPDAPPFTSLDVWRRCDRSGISFELQS
jgi:hypothetical protein